MRLMFKDLFTETFTGYRTKKTAELVLQKICEDNSDISAEEAEKMAKTVLELAGVKAGSDKKDALFFISSQQVSELAKLAGEYYHDGCEKRKR